MTKAKTPSKIDHSKLRATPQEEDFRHKYENEGGKLGQALIDGYFRAVQDLVGQVPATQPCRALEIGCGEGYSTKRLRSILPNQFSLEASEYVSDLLPHAKKHNPGLKIYQESVYELKTKDSSLELVFLLEVLEHLDYPDIALQEIKRVLKPGGYLILGVPREPIWRIGNFARGKYVKDFGNTTGHLNHWSKTSLKRFIGTHFGKVLATKSPFPWSIVLAQKNKK